MTKSKTLVQKTPNFDELSAAMDEHCAEIAAEEAALEATIARGSGKSVAGYRRAALDHYALDGAGSLTNVCVMCGFGIRSVLEVAHLDQKRENCKIENLAILCPNCHKMHDIGLIPTDVVRLMRDEKRKENWLLRIKDAGPKAAETRRKKTVAAKKTASAKKAWATRSKNAKLI